MTILNAETVGKVIRKAREEKGLSQETLSSFAEIGRTHLSAIERGHRKPTLETFFRLSAALDMPASDLVKRIEQELAMENERISKPQ